MTVRQAFFRGVLILILCSVGFMYSQSDSVFKQVEEAVAASVKEGVQVGNSAASFELPTLLGKTVALEEYHGKPIVVNFFATWCGPCQEEMPIIMEMEKRLRDQGAVFVAVNMTSQEASKEEITPFLNHYGANFDVLLDETGDVMKAYQIIGIPTTVVIDENGIIVQRINGGLTHSMMEDLYVFR
ncbi:TlpA disulfide reductase family protein [Bacillus sp. FJAT-45037]|uniref:TlpA disulfide reductase family protein n=1 Tax=Bacillus sp. FJAT-45037 TaxID=2011007 RepID=UPI000C235E57|nr:TlpA disulfide reductase family protein [Bacillus sp. FJAT-45037]